MKKVITIAAAIIAASLASCATPPENIRATKIAGAAPCTENDRKHLVYLIEEQGKMARNDALGVLIIGLPVASMGKKDHKAEIAELKGRCGG